MTRRAELIGRGLFEVMPESALRSSLDRVIEHRAPDAMAVRQVRRLPGGEERLFRFTIPIATT